MKYKHDSILPVHAFKRRGSVVGGHGMRLHGGDSWPTVYEGDEDGYWSTTGGGESDGMPIWISHTNQFSPWYQPKPEEAATAPLAPPPVAAPAPPPPAPAAPAIPFLDANKYGQDSDEQRNYQYVANLANRQIGMGRYDVAQQFIDQANELASQFDAAAAKEAEINQRNAELLQNYKPFDIEKYGFSGDEAMGYYMAANRANELMRGGRQDLAQQFIDQANRYVIDQERAEAERQELQQKYGTIAYGTGMGPALGYAYEMQNSEGNPFRRFDAQGNLTEFVDQHGQWQPASIFKPVGYQYNEDTGQYLTSYMTPAGVERVDFQPNKYHEDQGGFLGEGGWKNIGMLALTGLTAGLAGAGVGAGLAGGVAGANAAESAVALTALLEGGSTLGNALQIGNQLVNIGTTAYDFLKDSNPQAAAVVEKLQTETAKNEASGMSRDQAVEAAMGTISGTTAGATSLGASAADVRDAYKNVFGVEPPDEWIATQVATGLDKATLENAYQGWRDEAAASQAITETVTDTTDTTDQIGTKTSSVDDVARLYREIFGREPDQEDVKNFVENGGTLAQIADYLNSTQQNDDYNLGAVDTIIGNANNDVIVNDGNVDSYIADIVDNIINNNASGSTNTTETTGTTGTTGAADASGSTGSSDTAGTTVSTDTTDAEDDTEEDEEKRRRRKRESEAALALLFPFFPGALPGVLEGTYLKGNDVEEYDPFEYYNLTRNIEPIRAAQGGSPLELMQLQQGIVGYDPRGFSNVQHRPQPNYFTYGSNSENSQPTTLAGSQLMGKPRPNIPVTPTGKIGSGDWLYGAAGNNQLSPAGAALPTIPSGMMAQGGLAHGGGTDEHIPEFITGATGHYVRGRGDGQSDDIPAMLADGEYVFDSSAVSTLGNGSSDAGAKLLDAFRETLREHTRAAPKDKIPPKASPLMYMQEAMKKVGMK